MKRETRTSKKAHTKARSQSAAGPLSVPVKRRRTAKQERAEDLRANADFLTMHRTRCAVCKHPQFNEITKAYLKGTPQNDITEAYGLPEGSLWRHVRALQLRTLREARAAKSSVLRARHILSLSRFDEDHLPCKEITLLAMKMEHDAYISTLPKKVHVSGSIEIRDKLIPLGQDIARNILIRMGIKRDVVEKLMPHATLDAMHQHGLVKEEESDETDSPT